MMPQLNSNLEKSAKEQKIRNKLFDILLWLNLPIIYGVLIYIMYQFSAHNYRVDEVMGLVFSLEIVSGRNGINVVRELENRQEPEEQFIGKVLLIPSLYMCFYTEQNYGHPQNAATPVDPSSARYNENLYAFWLRSVPQQYINAMHIRNRFLKSENRGFFSVTNDMFWYHVIQVSYLLIAGIVLG